MQGPEAQRSPIEGRRAELASRLCLHLFDHDAGRLAVPVSQDPFQALPVRTFGFLGRARVDNL